MNANLLTEELFTFAVLAKKHPACRSVSPRTLFRWSARGARGVRLESASIGGVRKSSLAALDRFFALLNPAEVTDAGAPRSPSERNRASEAAARELGAAGA